MPIVPILGIIVSAAIIFGLVWLAIGFIIYFGYSKKNSKLNNPGS